MDVLAKKRVSDGQLQDIYGHSLSVVKECFNIVNEYEIKRLSNNVWWSTEKIYDLIFFCAYFHDLWKITKEFQDTINYNKKSFHAYYTMMCLGWINDFNIQIKKKSRWWGEIYTINLLQLVVGTHHSQIKLNKPYTSERFTSDNCNPKFLENELEEYFNNYEKYYEQFLEKKCFYNYNFKINYNIYDDWKKIVDWTILNLEKSNDNFDKIRMLYWYLLWVLNLWDWLASARFDKKFNSNELSRLKWHELPQKNYLKTIISNKIWKKINWLPFQKEASNINWNIFMEIPTWEWKTEASLLWAINNISDNNTKIIYTLPTQTTSNKLFDRVVEIFWQHNCWIIHSNADIVLRWIFEKEDWNIDKRYKSEALFQKTFNKPITVSTLDSFLKYFINLWKWHIATKNYFNAVLIIDEVHSYDFRLLGFLKDNLQKLDDYWIKICIMSASFPNKLKEILLGDELWNKYRYISQNDLYQKKSNNIYKKEKNIEEDISLIDKKYNDWKNILCIRNTVKDATNMYNKLKEQWYNCMLYHSNFKRIDRLYKEDEIFYRLGGSHILDKYKNKNDFILLDNNSTYIEKSFFDYLNDIDNSDNFILISTQVVEMSLDIDFDIMLTDNAPFDALVQRFWRVNRKKLEEKKWEIYIYWKLDYKEWKYPYPTFLLNETFNTIKEWYFTLEEYNNWLNNIIYNVFDNIDYQNDINKLYVGENLYKEKLKHNYWIFKYWDDYDIRDIDKSLEKEECFIYYDYENYKNILNENFTVWIPKFIFKQNTDKVKFNIWDLESDNIYHKVVDIWYDYEKWIDTEKTLFDNFI